jgi:hypothetical protein
MCVWKCGACCCVKLCHAGSEQHMNTTHARARAHTHSLFLTHKIVLSFSHTCFIQHLHTSSAYTLDTTHTHTHTQQVRSLAMLALSNTTLALQPSNPALITVAPSIEISGDVHITVTCMPGHIVTSSLSSFTLSPPRKLVGRDVPVALGLRVVLSETSQRFPRIGRGRIVELLSANLDMVSVVWDVRQSMPAETMPVGLGGVYSLAVAEVGAYLRIPFGTLTRCLGLNSH